MGECYNISIFFNKMYDLKGCFMNFMLSVKEFYIKKYSFLNISEEYWNYLFTKLDGFVNHDGMDIEYLKSLIDVHLQYYINSKIYKGDTLIIRNLFSMVDWSLENEDTLINILKLLNEYHITFSEDYYLKVRQEIPTFNCLLEHLGYQDITFRELKEKLLQKNQQKRKVKKNLDDYFKKANEELSFEDKQIIDFLFSKLPTMQQRKIKKYLRGEEIEEKEICKDILLLQKNFLNFKKHGFSVSLFIGTIYKYFFQLNDLFTLKDKEFIDILFQQLSKEQQEGISGYIKRVYSSTSEQGQKALNDIRYLRVKYKKCRELGYVPLHYFNTIYKYFIKDGQILKEDDKAYIDTLFHQLSKERQEGIKAYLNGISHQKDDVVRQALYDIGSMQKEFKNYKNGNLTSHSKRNLYSYFQSSREELTKEDIQVIDILFKRLSLSRQEGITGYLEGIYNSSTPIGKKAHNDIVLLQQQFKRYQIKGSIDKLIYDYFKTEKGFLSVEEKSVIDNLFATFSKEYQEGILGYMRGMYHKDSEIGKRAYNNIRWMQRQFDKYFSDEYLFMKEEKDGRRKL